MEWYCPAPTRLVVENVATHKNCLKCRNKNLSNFLKERFTSVSGDQSGLAAITVGNEIMYQNSKFHLEETGPWLRSLVMA